MCIRDREWVIAANAECAKLLRPDLIIFLDITPAASLERIRKSRAFLDLYETEERLKGVRANYFKAMDRIQEEENILVIDATLAEGEIANQIWQAVSALLK